MQSLEKLTNDKTLPYRCKFIILNVLDLRKTNWMTKREEKAAAIAERAKKNSEFEMDEDGHMNFNHNNSNNGNGGNYSNNNGKNLMTNQRLNNKSIPFNNISSLSTTSTSPRASKVNPLSISSATVPNTKPYNNSNSSLNTHNNLRRTIDSTLPSRSVKFAELPPV